jgi:5-methylcytosine-specific restriction endonuclease McrA
MQRSIELPKSRPDAKASGASQYFTGKPCKNGHIAKRQTVNGTCDVCSYAKKKKWRLGNVEQRRKSTEQMQEWRFRNPERSSAINSKHNGKYVVEWRKENRTKVRSYGSNYRARSKSAEGSFTDDDINRMFKQQKGRCAYYQHCRSKLTKGYHVDHIVSLRNGGANFPSNLQLTCQKCNCRKNRRNGEAYSRELGLLI